MNGYLLDTNVISEIRKPKPDRRVVRWLEATPESSLYLSCLSLGEIRLGIELLDVQAKRRDLERWLDVDLRRRFERRVLPISSDIAECWGRLEAAARRSKGRLPTIDALLAATAVQHGLTLVTRNVDDFASMQTPIFDPWST